MLFKIDYQKETPEIRDQIKKYESSKEEVKLQFGKTIKVPKFSIENEYSIDFWRHIGLFPNNELIDPRFEEKELYKTKINEFFDLLNEEDTKEREILNFIRDREAFFIIASLLRLYDFGHHCRYLFREFPLGTSYAVDFLIIGKGSGGYRLIFVELESVNGRITNAKGELGEVFRKGLNQVEDWKSWLDSNYSNLREIFNKSKGKYENLPKELIEYDSTRMYYVVIGGRRSDFSEKTYTLRRRLERNSIKLLHYDNLVDLSEDLINYGDY